MAVCRRASEIVVLKRLVWPALSILVIGLGSFQSSAQVIDPTVRTGFVNASFNAAFRAGVVDRQGVATQSYLNQRWQEVSRLGLLDSKQIESYNKALSQVSTPDGEQNLAKVMHAALVKVHFDKQAQLSRLGASNFACEVFAPIQQTVTLNGAAKTYNRFRVNSADALRCLSQGPAATWKVTKLNWDSNNESEWQSFVKRIGLSGCKNVDQCLTNPAINPYLDETDLQGSFYSDCADFPYYLRMYYSWKKGLPFHYINGIQSNPLTPIQQRNYENALAEVMAKTYESEIKRQEAIAKVEERRNPSRYNSNGNYPTSRRIEPFQSPGQSFFNIASRMVNTVSSGTLRMNLTAAGQLLPDFYSPRITPQSIRPGTVVYRANGHVVIVSDIEVDGQVRFTEAHPDNSVSSNNRFTADYRMDQAQRGDGFKNWRPFEYRNVKFDANSGSYVWQAADGVGRPSLRLLADSEIPRRGGVPPGKNSPEELTDFSLEQYFGHIQTRPIGWTGSQFCQVENGQCIMQNVKTNTGADLLDSRGQPIVGPLAPLRKFKKQDEDEVEMNWIVRTKEGVVRELSFEELLSIRLSDYKKIDPLALFQTRVSELCSAMQDRLGAVDEARELSNRNSPLVLPANVWGAEGEWYSFSTPGRDTGLKNRVQQLKVLATNLVELRKAKDQLYDFPAEADLKRELARVYSQTANSCQVVYKNSEGKSVPLSLDGAIKRVSRFSFDPYVCVERRWGATGRELATCQESREEGEFAEQVVLRFALTTRRDPTAQHGQNTALLREQNAGRTNPTERYDVLKHILNLN